MRRRPERWSTRFGGWVQRFTVRRIVAELAKDPDLAVRPSEVYAWLAGVTMPRPPRAMAMVELSGGVITLADVYRHRQQIVAEARR